MFHSITEDILLRQPIITNQGLTPCSLKKILKKMRPDYTIPSEIHVLNELPIVSWDSLPNVKM
jgi:hypothetical protein